MSEVDLATRLRRLEDIEEIRGMKALYAHACDEKFTDTHEPRSEQDINALIQPMAERVFAEDAVWHVPPDEPVRGRAAIADRLVKSRWTFAMHYYVNPVIDIRGDTAHATWMLFEPLTVAETNKSMWMSAMTEEDYVRTSDGWRLREYFVRLKFISEFTQPWSERRISEI